MPYQPVPISPARYVFASAAWIQALLESASPVAALALRKSLRCIVVASREKMRMVIEKGVYQLIVCFAAKNRPGPFRAGALALSFCTPDAIAIPGAPSRIKPSHARSRNG